MEFDMRSWKKLNELMSHNVDEIEARIISVDENQFFNCIRHLESEAVNQKYKLMKSQEDVIITCYTDVQTGHNIRYVEVDNNKTGYWQKKEKKWSLKCDLYNVKFSGMSETTIEAPDFSNLIAKFERRRHRISFQSKCIPFRFDLSRINETEYEIEIELDQKQHKNTKRASNDILYFVEKILQWCDNHPLLLTTLQKKTYMSMYHNLCGKNYFVGCEPRAMQKHDIDLLAREEYAATIKFDGERQLMLLIPNMPIVLINKLLQLKLLPFNHRCDQPSLLDCEYIVTEEDNVQILVFDLLICKGVDVRCAKPVNTLKDRICTIDEILSECYRSSSCNQQFTCSINAKEYFFDIDSTLLKNYDYTKDWTDNYPRSDGIIFVPVKMNYSNTIAWTGLLKWKPKEFITIDFLLKKTETPNNFILTVNTSKGHVPFTPREKLEYIELQVNSRISNIVECAFDEKLEKFVFIRFRPDKKNANFETIANDNWNSIMFPICIEDLNSRSVNVEAPSDITNHLYAVVDGFLQNESHLNAIDLFCPPDIFKQTLNEWKKVDKLAALYVVSKDQSSMQVVRDTFCNATTINTLPQFRNILFEHVSSFQKNETQFLQSPRKNVHHLPISMQNVQADVIFCHMGISEFCTSAQSLQSFFALYVLPFMSPTTLFVLTFLDGAQIWDDCQLGVHQYQNGKKAAPFFVRSQRGPGPDPTPDCLGQMAIVDNQLQALVFTQVLLRLAIQSGLEMISIDTAAQSDDSNQDWLQLHKIAIFKRMIDPTQESQIVPFALHELISQFIGGPIDQIICLKTCSFCLTERFCLLQILTSLNPQMSSSMKNEENISDCTEEMAVGLMADIFRIRLVIFNVDSIGSPSLSTHGTSTDEQTQLFFYHHNYHYYILVEKQSLKPLTITKKNVASQPIQINPTLVSPIEHQNLFNKSDLEKMSFVDLKMLAKKYNIKQNRRKYDIVESLLLLSQ